MALVEAPFVRLFSADKVINSRLLNAMGAQVFRTVMAHWLYNLRPVAVVAELRAKLAPLHRDGLLVWPNFLPPDQFELVQQECMQLLNDDAVPRQVRAFGPNRREVISLCSCVLESISHTATFLADPTLKAILMAAEKRLVTPYAILERLLQGPADEQKDGETDLHSDIFFNTHKFWFYLHDVSMAEGPLAYVKGSHRLSLTQLSYTYQHSQRQDQSPSRRITPEEIGRLGLQETVVTCPQNTLVLANTHGYHRRLRGQPGRVRCAIYAQLRTNPFLLWGRQ
jgi:hypothetical protein